MRCLNKFIEVVVDAAPKPDSVSNPTASARPVVVLAMDVFGDVRLVDPFPQNIRLPGEVGAGQAVPKDYKTSIISGINISVCRDFGKPVLRKTPTDHNFHRLSYLMGSLLQRHHQIACRLVSI